MCTRAATVEVGTTLHEMLGKAYVAWGRIGACNLADSKVSNVWFTCTVIPHSEMVRLLLVNGRLRSTRKISNTVSLFSRENYY